MRNRKELETFVENAEANIFSVKVTEMRVYVGSSWMWKSDFELISNGTEENTVSAETLVGLWLKEAISLISTTTPKNNINTKRKGGSNMLSIYQGICNNPQCTGHSPKFIKDYNAATDFINDRFDNVGYANAIMADAVKNLNESVPLLKEHDIVVQMPSVNAAFRSINTKSPEFLALSGDEKKLVYTEKSKLKNPILFSTVSDTRVSGDWKKRIGEYYDAKHSINDSFDEMKQLTNALGFELKGWKMSLNNHLLSKHEEGTNIYKENLSFVVDVDFSWDSAQDKSIPTCVHCGDVARLVNSKGKVDHLGISKEEVNAEILSTLDVDKICADVINDVDTNGVFTLPEEDVISISDVLEELEASDLVQDILDGKEGLTDAEYNGYVKESFSKYNTIPDYTCSNDEYMDELENSLLNSIYCPWEDVIQGDRIK
jgi:hypothetical protein